MARKKKADNSAPGAPLWVLTFSDMMSLLLTFFVMLVAMSSLDNKKIKEALSSLHGAFGVMRLNQTTPKDRPLQMKAMSLQINKQRTPDGKLTRKNLKGAAQSIMQRLDEDPDARKAVEVEVTEKGLNVRMSGDVLFDVGSSQLSAAGRRLLDKVAPVLQPYNNRIEIRGHSDDSPPAPGGKYESNWHIGFLRAYAVMQYYQVEQGMARERFDLGSSADTRPVAPNDTVSGRAKNRRVEILLLADDEDMHIYENPFFKPLVPYGDIRIEPY